METEKLYYHDSFIKSFSAVVTGCTQTKQDYAITLNRTAFYPEGGGQPADWGMLNDVPVTDVHEKNGIIVHSCPSPIPVGTTVTGTLDWDRRFDHMQCHSGEHIVSGILCARHNCDNVGFHLGSDTITIDFNTELTWEQLLAIQDEANALIWSDVPVEITHPDRETLAALDYRSKKELSGDVRIVTFPQGDCCACCGTHVARTGQIGLVKMLSCQKFRGGVRIEMLCGMRALTYFEEIFAQNRIIAQLLSAKPIETAQAAIRMDSALTAAKEQIAQLETLVFDQIATEHQGQQDVLLFHPNLSSDSLRRLCLAVSQVCTGLTAVFSQQDDRYGYALCQSQGENILPLVKSLNTTLIGRGGGKNGFAQGSVQASEEQIRTFFS